MHGEPHTDDIHEERRELSGNDSESWTVGALRANTLLIDYLDERRRYRRENLAFTRFVETRLTDDGRLLWPDGEYAERWAREIDRGRFRVTTWGFPWTVALELDPVFSGAGAWIWWLALSGGAATLVLRHCF